MGRRHDGRERPLILGPVDEAVAAGVRLRLRVTRGLHVIDVHYRTPELLGASAESLLRQAEAVPELQITIVDNSCDATIVGQLRDRLPLRVDHVEAPANLGFAAGCNLGAKRSSLSHVRFLNPDTEVPLGSLASLWRRLQAFDDRALLGPRHFADRELLFAHAPLRACRWLDRCHDLSHARGWSPRRSLRYLDARWRIVRAAQPVAVRAISGGCLGTSRAVFDRLGGWDAGYWFCGEDNELCLRARDHGVDVLDCPDIPVVHFMEASSRQLPRAVAESRTSGRERFKRQRYGRWRIRLERLRALPSRGSSSRRVDLSRPTTRAGWIGVGRHNLPGGARPAHRLPRDRSRSCRCRPSASRRRWSSTRLAPHRRGLSHPFGACPQRPPSGPTSSIFPLGLLSMTRPTPGA
jgi:N-acetylglucosaminyl-diphospho-decaprenol L-rhamnosyltransferase